MTEVVEGRRSYEEAAIHKHTDNRCLALFSRDKGTT